MTIAVFGATGKTGKFFIQKALEQGLKIRALARDPDILVPHFGLEVIKGDVLDGGKVMLTLSGCQAVVIVLGKAKKGPVDVCSSGTVLILQGMAKVGIKPVVAVTSLGLGDSKDQVPFIFKIFMATLLKNIMMDKEKQEHLLQESGTDWTIVRPTGLTLENGTKSYYTGTGSMKEGIPQGTKIRGLVSREDVADFLLKIVNDPEQYKHKTYYITN